MLRVIKPKHPQARRALKKRESKIEENVKQLMVIKGCRSSQLVNDAMVDLSSYKKPHVISFGKKNEIHPFDDDSQLNFYSQKSDASLFLFGSHSKKRPHHLTLGRTFDHRVLDMVELSIQHYQSIKSFKPAAGSCGIGMKPLFTFSGEFFEHTEEGRALKSLVLDVYRGETISQISLKGLEHVISLTGTKDMLYLRVFKVLLKKSGSRLPRVELEEIGPRMDLKMDRVRLADRDLMKMATRVSKTLQPKKVKNVNKDELGDTFGRVHVGRQDLTKLQTRKMKGLKGKLPEAEDNSQEDDASEFMSEEERSE